MTVVYLAVSDAEQQLLIERYLSDPKPVLWRGGFQAKGGRNCPQDRGAVLSASDSCPAAELCGAGARDFAGRRPARIAAYGYGVSGVVA